MLAERLAAATVWAAHADAWQVEGRVRTPYGGGATELPGVRLMASGLPYAQWNSGDVTDPALVDLDAVRAWYAAREVPWGLRVPPDVDWPHGRLALRKRCMGLRPDAFAAAPCPPGVTIRPAAPSELELVSWLDATSFGDPVEPNLGWVGPQLGAEGFRHALALLDGEPVGVATGIRAFGEGGHSVGVFGVGVLPKARRRGIGAALTSWLVTWGIDAGATLAHLNPETEDAARLYARLGFTEVTGLDIYVDMVDGGLR